MWNIKWNILLLFALIIMLTKTVPCTVYAESDFKQIETSSTSTTTATPGSLILSDKSETTVDVVYSDVINNIPDYMLVNNKSYTSTTFAEGDIVTLKRIPPSDSYKKGYVSKVTMLTSFTITDANGTIIPLDENNSFLMPDCSVTISGTTKTLYRMYLRAYKDANYTYAVQREYTTFDEVDDIYTSIEENDEHYLYIAEGDIVTMSADIKNEKYALDRVVFVVDFNASNTIEYVESGAIFRMPGEMIDVTPRFAYQLHTVEYTTDGIPSVDETGNIVVNGTTIYQAGERGSWSVPNHTETFDFEVIPTTIQAEEGYCLSMPYVFYYGADKAYHQENPENISINYETGELTVKNCSQSIIIYYTFEKIEITPQYTVILPAIVTMAQSNTNASIMTAEIPFSILYTLPEDAAITVRIPDDFTLENQEGEILDVSSDVYCFTWTNDTIGTTIEENGTYKGSDVFTLTANTTVGTWEGQLCVTIDVIEY